MSGEQLRELRKNRNLTQQQLADKLGVSRGIISYWENGKSYPTNYTINLLNRFFNIEMEDPTIVRLRKENKKLKEELAIHGDEGLDIIHELENENKKLQQEKENLIKYLENEIKYYENRKLQTAINGSIFDMFEAKIQILKEILDKVKRGNFNE